MASVYKKAIKKANETFCDDVIQDAYAVRKWHRIFRTNGEYFNNPSICRQKKKHKLPPLLDMNPEIKNAICTFIKENLSELTSEFLLSYIQETVLPNFLLLRKQETSNKILTIQDILKEHGLSKLCLTTVYTWLQKLGYLYQPRKKSYYVDAHEKPSTAAYRKTFVERYLQYELRAHRLIQITKVKASELQMEEQGLSGFAYEHNGIDMIEYHVDNHPDFHKLGQSLHPFGGNLSVRYKQSNKPGC